MQVLRHRAVVAVAGRAVLQVHRERPALLRACQVLRREALEVVVERPVQAVERPARPLVFLVHRAEAAVVELRTVDRVAHREVLDRADRVVEAAGAEVAVRPGQALAVVQGQAPVAAAAVQVDLVLVAGLMLVTPRMLLLLRTAVVRKIAERRTVERKIVPRVKTAASRVIAIVSALMVSVVSMAGAFLKITADTDRDTK